MSIQAPPPCLADKITALWALKGDPSGLCSGLPKPYVEFIVSLSGEHTWQESRSSKAHAYAIGWLTPVQSGPRYAETCGGMHLIGARLNIGAARAIFGRFANQDFDTPIRLEDLLGHEAYLLRERLFEQPDDISRMQCLSSWLQERLTTWSGMILPSLSFLAGTGWRVDYLAAYYGLSNRGLRKRFRDQFGLGPKFWFQLNRFDGLLGTNWSRIRLADAALAYGYTDQAHMAKEFRRFSGTTLTSYSKERIFEQSPAEAPHFLPGTP